MRISRLDTETYEGEVTFMLELQLEKDAPAATAELHAPRAFQVCNATECDPGNWTGSFALTRGGGRTRGRAGDSGGIHGSEAAAQGRGRRSDGGAIDSESWPAFLLMAFGFGLASIFTPCVFPMIPITMSYFYETKRGSVKQAVMFCLGIIVLFSGHRAGGHGCARAGGRRALGQNPWVNGFIAVLFVVFGLSLLGAFEITIPSAILTRLNNRRTRAASPARC